MIHPSTPGLKRRNFLGLAATGLTALPLTSLIRPPALPTPRTPPTPPGSFSTDPFGLGVASGDPAPDGMVLWTRIAPEPVAEDGLGGVPDPRRPVGVSWELSTDDTFGPRSIVRRGVTLATAQLGYSVHVEVDGLKADREYWYRFRVGRFLSPVGRTRTAPAFDARLHSMTFAFMSCQAYNNGYYTALRHLSEDDLDVAFHLGDYIYEGAAQSGVAGRGHLPAVVLDSLSDYRIRYGQYKSDPDLQAAHASVAFVVVPDNHDIDYDRTVEPDPAPALARRAASFQAYYENLPLRRTALPRGPAMQLFRRIRYGRLADFHVLDTEQYSSDPTLDVETNVVARQDPNRTLLGPRQEQWLVQGMTTSRASWNVLAQQSKVAETDDVVGPGESYGGGGNWDGYDYSRTKLFDTVHERGIDNMVVVSGDAHANIASNLKPRFTDEDSRSSALSSSAPPSPPAATGQKSSPAVPTASRRTRTTCSTTSAAATSAAWSPPTSSGASTWCCRRSPLRTRRSSPVRWATSSRAGRGSLRSRTRRSSESGLHAEGLVRSVSAGFRRVGSPPSSRPGGRPPDPKGLHQGVRRSRARPVGSVAAGSPTANR